MAGQADSHGSAVISLDSSSQQLLSLLRISSSTEREREEEKGVERREEKTRRKGEARNRRKGKCKNRQGRKGRNREDVER